MQKTQKTVVLIAASASSFLAPFMGSALTVALPGIGREYAMNAVTLGWIMTAYILASAVFLIPFGRLADIHGREKVFTWGIAAYALFSFLTPLSSSSMVFIISRVLQGIGGAMIFGTGVAILSSVYPPGERGKALGLNTACVYLGLTLGPFIGGILTGQFGWRSIFFINGATGGLLLFFVILKLKGEKNKSGPEQLDWIGSALYCLSVSSLLIGFSKLPALFGLALVLAGTVLFAVFFYWEKNSDRPVIHIRLFQDNAIFTFSNLAALVNYCSTSATAFLLSLYLQIVKGYNPKHVGIILVSQPIVMTVFSPLSGRLSDRIESRTIASLGMAVNTAALILLSFLDKNSPQGFIISCLFLLGFGIALFSSPNTNAVMGSVEKRFYGVASAMLGTMRLTGQMMSMGIAMLIFSVLIGNQRITPAVQKPFVASMKTAFIIFAVLSFGGIFASLARGKAGNKVTSLKLQV